MESLFNLYAGFLSGRDISHIGVIAGKLFSFYRIFLYIDDIYVCIIKHGRIINHKNYFDRRKFTSIAKYFHKYRNAALHHQFFTSKGITHFL